MILYVCVCASEFLTLIERSSPITKPIRYVVTKRYEVVNGHSVKTTHYSNQQGSKSLQTPLQVQPPENIENLSTSNLCLNGWNYSL